MTKFRYAEGDRLVVTGDTRNWQHGFKTGAIVTVVEQTFPKDTEPTYVCDDGGELMWWVHEDDLRPVTETQGEDVDAVDHPVVVIDPGDTEAVKRLMKDLWDLTGSTLDEHDPTDVAEVQEALRRYAQPPPPPPPPPPPKPDEPQGLGAVVEDAEGARWVRINHPATQPWLNGFATLCWDRVGAVRVLSEGVVTE